MKSCRSDDVRFKRDFEMLLYLEPFRQWVIAVGDQKKVDWNVTLTPSPSINMKTVLHENPGCWMRLPSLGLEGDCQVTALMMRGHFEDPLIASWVQMNQKLEPIKSLESNKALVLSSIASGLIFGALVMVIALYVSLAWSHAREDESGAVLRKWKSVGDPATLVSTILGLAAIFCAFVSRGWCAYSLNIVVS
jgi:hypothetical protein